MLQRWNNSTHNEIHTYSSPFPILLRTDHHCKSGCFLSPDWENIAFFFPSSFIIYSGPNTRPACPDLARSHSLQTQDFHCWLSLGPRVFLQKASLCFRLSFRSCWDLQRAGPVACLSSSITVVLLSFWVHFKIILRTKNDANKIQFIPKYHNFSISGK